MVTNRSIELFRADTFCFEARPVNPDDCQTVLARWLARVVEGPLHADNPKSAVVLVSFRRTAEEAVSKALAAEQLSPFNTVCPGRTRMPDTPLAAAAALRRAAARLEGIAESMSLSQWQGHVVGRLVWPWAACAHNGATQSAESYLDACARVLQREAYVVAAAGSAPVRPPREVTEQTLLGETRGEALVDWYWKVASTLRLDDSNAVVLPQVADG